MEKDNQLGELGKLGNDKVGDLVRRYQAQKRRSKDFVTYLHDYFYERGPDVTPREEKLREYVDHLENCGSYLHFRDYYLKGDTRLVSANFCKKHLLCGLCAIRRAAKGAQDLHEKTKKVLSERSGLNAYYIVLTVKNHEDLSVAYRKLKSGWDKLKYTIRDAKRALKTKDPVDSKYSNALGSVFSGIEAGVYSIETTFNQEKETWHPHMNLLVLSRFEMDNESVSQEWEQKTGDSFITHCKRKDPVNDKGVVCEIMKYSMKFSELPFEQNVEAYLTLSGKRLKGTFGDFMGVDLDPDPADDTLEGEPYIEILYRYYQGEYIDSGERFAGVEKEKKSSVFVQSDLIPD